MAFTALDVKALREKTGLGMMDCKKALEENNGDMELAIEWLRKKGMAASAKKADRVAGEGIVEAYIHPGNQVGVLIELSWAQGRLLREYTALIDPPGYTPTAPVQPPVASASSVAPPAASTSGSSAAICSEL